MEEFKLVVVENYESEKLGGTVIITFCTSGPLRIGGKNLDTGSSMLGSWYELPDKKDALLLH